jgi:hypothetical protein
VAHFVPSNLSVVRNLRFRVTVSFPNNPRAVALEPKHYTRDVSKIFPGFGKPQIARSDSDHDNHADFFASKACS